MTTNSTREQCLITDLKNICSDIKVQITFANSLPEPVTGSDLTTWIKDTWNIILSDVIPEKFWTDHSMVKPTNVFKRLCERCNNGALCAVHLVLWSLCSQRCKDEIITLLQVAAQEWDSSRAHSKAHFLEAYVLCVKVHVSHSTPNLNSHNNDIKMSHVIEEAHLLVAAVVNSSSMFRILSYTAQPPSGLLVSYANFLKERQTEPQTEPNANTSTTKSGPQVVFSDHDLNNVRNASITKWFKFDIVRPVLNKIIGSKFVEALLEKIDDVVRRNGDRDLDLYLSDLQKCVTDSFPFLLKEDSSNANPDNMMQIRMITYLMLFRDFVKVGNSSPISRKDEMLMTKVLQSKMLQRNFLQGIENLVKDSSMPQFDARSLNSLIQNKFHLRDSYWNTLLANKSDILDQNNNVEEKRDTSKGHLKRKNQRKKKKSTNKRDKCQRLV